MSKSNFLLLALLLSAALFVACERVDALSDAAEIESIAITGSAPHTIELGAPAYMGNATFSIPVLYGKYDFPLQVGLAIHTSPDVSKLLSSTGGAFDREQVVFTAIDEVKLIDVVAASGKVKRWTIALQEHVLDEQTQINRFEIEGQHPAAAVVSPLTNIVHSRGEVEVLIIQAGFPLHIAPRITLAEGARFVGYEPGEPLVFDNVSAVVPLTVKAQSGKEQTWHIRLKQCPDIDGLPAVSITSKQRLDVPLHLLHFALSGGRLKDSASHFDTGVIELWADGVSFPLAIDAGTLPVAATSQLVGHSAGEPFIFNEYNDEAVFYIIDNISTYYKKWTVRLGEWISPDAGITGFTIDNATPGSIALAPAADINPHNATIHLTVLDGAAGFPLTLAGRLTLAEKATLKDDAPPAFVHQFGSIDDVFELTVVAENGDERTWKVKLINADPTSPKRTGTDVLAFTISHYTSQVNDITGSKVAINPVAAINKADKTIGLTIDDWKKYFPLTLTAAVELSTGATATGAGDVCQWTFASHNATETLQVTAEDGVTQAAWTVYFIDNEPPRSNAAGIADFSIVQTSANTAVDRYYIEPVKRQITVLLAHADFPVHLTPAVTVSDKAYLLDINSHEVITFNLFSDEKTIRVLSEDEQVANTWKIVLVNAPQLPNWALDEWDGNNPLGQWSNPNGTGVVNTTPLLPGFNHTGTAAQLTSTTATILGIKITAAGSLFLGHFDFYIGNRDKPKLMTWFGIPWPARPVALEADYTYRRGATLVDANHNPVDGHDEGSATIELLHWNGAGAFEYHTITPEDGYGTVPSNITVTARGANEHIQPAAGWQRLRLDLQTLDASKTPNYLHLTFASSTKGDKQIGAHGSTLVIDNVRLLYYVPETGAIEKAPPAPKGGVIE